ncbi:MAG: hypothetical protein ABIM46_08295 [candidate division WOR-3 bacterium]
MMTAIAILLSAGNIVVEDFQVIGADTSLAPVAAELLRASLASVAGYNIIKTEEKDKKALEGMGVEFTAKGSATQLGNQISIRVRVERLATGQAVFDEKYQVSSYEDLGFAIDMLCLSLKTGKKPQELAAKAILEETGMRPKRQSYTSLGGTFGSITPLMSSYGKDVGLIYGGMLTFNYETPYFMGQWATGIYGGSGILMFPLSIISLNWLPKGVSTVSPYLGFGGGLNLLNVPDSQMVYDPWYGDSVLTIDWHNIYGWGAYAGVGAVFLREYDFRPFFEVKYGYLFGKNPITDKYPQGIQISLGLTWHSTASPGCCGGGISTGMDTGGCLSY